MSDTPQPKTALWVKVVLGLSLALNLVIVGVVGGVAARGGPVERQGAAMNSGLPYLIALPREERVRLFRAARQVDGFQDRRSRRSAYEDMLVVLRSPEFDRGRAEALLVSHAAGLQSTQAAVQSVWLVRVEEMSRAERLEYADRIEGVLQRARKGREKQKP